LKPFYLFWLFFVVRHVNNVASLIFSTAAKLVNWFAEMDDKLVNLWEDYPSFSDVDNHSVQMK